MLPATAAAQVTNTSDTTAGIAAALPPTPLSSGVGSGFSGMIGQAPGGAAITVALDSDLFGNLSVSTAGGPCFDPTQDVAVMYIDSRPGGFASTTGLDDTSDLFRGAVSGNTGAAAAELTFAAGFEADFALAFQRDDVAGPPALFELQAGGALNFVTSAIVVETPTDTGGVCTGSRVRLTLADLGMAPGDSMDYVITLLNGTNAFRSNEFHGVATAPAANIGAAAFMLPAGSFNTFTSVAGRLVINETDADQVGTDTLEFIELFGTPNLDLTGLSIVLFNGSDDQSYLPAGISLDGESLDASGYHVTGSSAVANVDLILGSTDPGAPSSSLLQNGTDGVAVFSAPADLFPNDTPVASFPNLLWAGLVYDTADGDDTVLLAALTPGQPQVDERMGGDGAGDSIGRCANGSGLRRETDTFVAMTPTPGATNECVLCGNGAPDAGEACDDGVANGMTTCGCQTDCMFGTTVTDCGAAPSGTCDAQDTCDGAGACAARFAADTTICRAGVGSCGADEFCPGDSLTCPADADVIDGTSCTNGVACDGAEVCMSGACSDGAALCEDADICTADSCAEPDGTCTNSPITDCCVGDADCDDTNVCTTDTCNVSTNMCERVGVAGCCGADADCDDTNACTMDVCTVATGMCTNSATAGCCLADGDCDDSDACTMDTCDGSSMACTNADIAGCGVMDGGVMDGGVGDGGVGDGGVDDGGVMDGAVGDGGVMDGAVADSGVDSGRADSATPDGAVADSGSDSGPFVDSEGGCGCRVAGAGRSSNGAAATVFLLGALAWRRRRG